MSRCKCYYHTSYVIRLYGRMLGCWLSELRPSTATALFFLHCHECVHQDGTKERLAPIVSVFYVDVVNHRPGENFELRADLNSEYRDKRKDAIKRVIANMTVGKGAYIDLTFVGCSPEASPERCQRSLS